jgi:CP family cyanate transporter-like MFS transporter
MTLAQNPAVSSPAGHIIKLMSLLWLAGFAMRMPLLVAPPVIPLMHEQLHLSETQVGLLIGLPLALFAIAAIPGSLLIARTGATFAAVVGLTIAAIGGGFRGGAFDVWTLFAASAVMGFGIAIMQPGMPTLVREWLPGRVALGTIVYSNGMVFGAMLPSILTLPILLPLVGGSWRLDFVIWAVPAVLIALVLFFFSPRDGSNNRLSGAVASGGSWMPDWKSPLVWLLGFTFAANNSPFFATNAFIGDYLVANGQTAILGPTLAALNGAQIVALVILAIMSRRLELRAWPFLLFGPLMVAAFLGLMLGSSPAVMILCAGVIGIATALTMTAILALPPVLSAPRDVARNAAGMFTIAYSCAIIVPTICGALWDVTGKPWVTFLPLCLCAAALTVLGTAATRFKPAVEEAPRQ